MTLYDKKLNIDCITLEQKGDEVQLRQLKIIHHT